MTIAPRRVTFRYRHSVMAATAGTGTCGPRIAPSTIAMRVLAKCAAQNALSTSIIKSHGRRVAAIPSRIFGSFVLHAISARATQSNMELEPSQPALLLDSSRHPLRRPLACALLPIAPARAHASENPRPSTAAQPDSFHAFGVGLDGGGGTGAVSQSGRVEGDGATRQQPGWFQCDGEGSAT